MVRGQPARRAPRREPPPNHGERRILHAPRGRERVHRAGVGPGRTRTSQAWRPPAGGAACSDLARWSRPRRSQTGQRHVVSKPAKSLKAALPRRLPEARDDAVVRRELDADSKNAFGRAEDLHDLIAALIRLEQNRASEHRVVAEKVCSFVHPPVLDGGAKSIGEHRAWSPMCRPGARPLGSHSSGARAGEPASTGTAARYRPGRPSIAASTQRRQRQPSGELGPAPVLTQAFGATSRRHLLGAESEHVLVHALAGFLLAVGSKRRAHHPEAPGRGQEPPPATGPSQMATSY